MWWGDFTLGLTFGIAGIAASTSLSVLFAAVANTWLLGRRHNAVDLRSLPLMVGRTAAAAAAGTAAGGIVYYLLGPVLEFRADQRGVVGGSGRADPAAQSSSGACTLRAPERLLLGEAIDVVVRRRR